MSNEDRTYPYDLALNAAEFLVELLTPNYEKIMIVGSLRRHKPHVHDIDIVMIPRNDIILKQKIISGEFRGLPFEIYIADNLTYETLCLIRTGSKEHNKKLCLIAKSKGLQLKADGTGLIDKEGNIIENTEKGIIERLCGKWIAPHERD